MVGKLGALLFIAFVLNSSLVAENTSSCPENIAMAGEGSLAHGVEFSFSAKGSRTKLSEQIKTIKDADGNFSFQFSSEGPRCPRWKDLRALLQLGRGPITPLEEWHEQIVRTLQDLDGVLELSDLASFQLETLKAHSVVQERVATLRELLDDLKDHGLCWWDGAGLIEAHIRFQLSETTMARFSTNARSKNQEDERRQLSASTWLLALQSLREQEAKLRTSPPKTAIFK
ncbi:MAG: hypothetical protein EA369_06155 [Bradymonadales bacterium]|nr:MAG: hypothetical protein EA369_06155 [Bradymonadales bacterium]